MEISIVLWTIYILSVDFSICTAMDNQRYPCAIYANNQYYLFWLDDRYVTTDATFSIYGARVSSTGSVLDPDGKSLFRLKPVQPPAVAFDGTNFLVVFRNGDC